MADPIAYLHGGGPPPNAPKSKGSDEEHEHGEESGEMHEHADGAMHEQAQEKGIPRRHEVRVSLRGPPSSHE